MLRRSVASCQRSSLRRTSWPKRNDSGSAPRSSKRHVSFRSLFADSAAPSCVQLSRVTRPLQLLRYLCRLLRQQSDLSQNQARKELPCRSSRLSSLIEFLGCCVIFSDSSVAILGTCGNTVRNGRRETGAPDQRGRPGNKSDRRPQSNPATHSSSHSWSFRSRYCVH